VLESKVNLLPCPTALPRPGIVLDKKAAPLIHTTFLNIDILFYVIFNPNLILIKHTRKSNSFEILIKY
jgi:hypothetical protein